MRKTRLKFKGVMICSYIIFVTYEDVFSGEALQTSGPAFTFLQLFNTIYCEQVSNMLTYI